MHKNIETVKKGVFFLMITISLCMIVKNEETVLARCLSCIKDVVDEIVIVDTGSSDRTKEIAAEFTEHIYDFPWIDDFAKARNFAFSKATMDYQMWLDADDILPEEEQQKLMTLKHTLPSEIDVVTMKYHIAYDDAGRPTFTSTRERLLRRAARFLWNDPVHEYIAMCGKIFASDISVYHKKGNHTSSDRNLNIYENRISAGETLSPRSTYYYARELMDHARFPEAAETFRAFLTDGKGWVEDNIGACLAMGRCSLRMGKQEEAKLSFLRSFLYDLPRPEICCEIAYLYMRSSDFVRASYWFETALHAPRQENGGFFLSDYKDYIPHLELCVCSYRLGLLDKAIFHNEKAGESKPESLAVLSNRQFFQSIKKN